MNTDALKFQSLSLNNTKAWIAIGSFIVANILFPQLFHQIHLGGVTWLPIYFFTLVGAYRYGWKVGLVTALLSPLVNSMLFGMPTVASLPAITLKSALLAGAAGYAAHRFHKVSILILTGVVLAYQMVGTLGEWIICGDFIDACQDFRIGIPGMLLQIFGGWAVIKLIRK